MTDYSITLPSYSIGEQVYKQIPTVCAPFGATAVVIGGHKAMAAVRERLLAAMGRAAPAAPSAAERTGAGATGEQA